MVCVANAVKTEQVGQTSRLISYGPLFVPEHFSFYAEQPFFDRSEAQSMGCVEIAAIYFQVPHSDVERLRDIRDVAGDFCLHSASGCDAFVSRVLDFILKFGLLSDECAL